MGGVDMLNFPQNPEHAVERLTTFKKALMDQEIPPKEKAIHLAWILHLTGDIHQPLHNASLVSARHPGGDGGGKAFKLGNEWPGNLHAYWDGILDLAYDLDYGDYSFKELVKIANKITKEHSLKELSAKVSLKEPMDWSDEGNHIVKIAAYPTYLREDEKPSARYQESTYKHCSYHIALAGYRLADLLNSIFDN
jgi:hypothetical protein